jgi:hypothetical protein
MREVPRCLCARLPPPCVTRYLEPPLCRDISSRLFASSQRPTQIAMSTHFVGSDMGLRASTRLSFRVMNPRDS